MILDEGVDLIGFAFFSINGSLVVHVVLSGSTGKTRISHVEVYMISL